MNFATGDVTARTKRLVLFQILAGAVTALGFGFGQSIDAAISALFGAGISIVSALLLGTGVRKAGQSALADPKRSMGILYFGAVQRFVLVLVLFILGAKVLVLDPMAMGAGFIFAQLGFVLQFSRMSKT